MQPEGVTPFQILGFMYFVSSTHESSLTDRCFKPVIVSYIYIYTKIVLIR